MVNPRDIYSWGTDKKKKAKVRREFNSKGDSYTISLLTPLLLCGGDHHKYLELFTYFLLLTYRSRGHKSQKEKISKLIMP